MKIYLFKDYKKYFKEEKNSFYASSIEKLKNKQTNKKQKIYIYDKTYIKERKHKEVLHINNHINKSGTNPFLNTHLDKIEFYDITQIYDQKPEGVITTCLGKKYKKNNKEQKYPSAFLAYFAIYLYTQGYEKITGKIINLKR